MKKERKQKDQSKQVFTPEQVLAMNVLREIYPHSINQFFVDQITESCFRTNFKAFVPNHITKDMLPKGESWNWNQSNARVNYNLGHDTTVTMYKLNPRRSIEGGSQPSYKLWVYLIQAPNLNCSFLWCTKGEQNSDGMDICLDDLDFLAEFMEPEKAAEIFGKN